MIEKLRMWLYRTGRLRDGGRRATTSDILAFGRVARDRSFAGIGRPKWTQEHLTEIDLVYVEQPIQRLRIEHLVKLRCLLYCFLNSGEVFYFGMDFVEEDYLRLRRFDVNILSEVQRTALASAKFIPIEEAQP